MAKKLQVTIDGKEYVSQETKKASQGISDMANTTDTKSKAMVVAASTVKIAFAAVASAVGSLAVLTAKAIKEAADMQTVSTSFEVLIGDVDKAKRTIADLRSFAARTPLEFNDISTAAQNLMAFGSEADEVKDQLSMLGDIAMGQADKLESIVRAYGKIQAKGKASMEELNMVTEAGVPVLQALADMYGTTTTKVLEMVSAGKVGFSDVDQAFKDMTSSGGQFYGMMDKQSKTFNGMVSTLKDNLNLIMTRLGEAVLPTATQLLGDAMIKLDEFIASDRFDQLLQKVAIFAAQTYSVFSHVGMLVGALYSDIKKYIDMLFSPDVGNLAVKYAEAIFNNLIKYWNTPLEWSDYLWKAIGLPETAKLPTVKWSGDEGKGEFASAIEGLSFDLQAVADAVRASWPKKTPINPTVENSRTYTAGSTTRAAPAYTGSLGLSIPALGGMVVPFGVASEPVPGWPFASDGGGSFGKMLADQLGEVFSGSGLDDLIKAPLGAFTDLAGSVVPLIGSFSSIQALLNPLQTILASAMEVLQPVIDSVLSPLVGILKVIGQLIGGMLTPVIQLLVPAIKFVADVFIWLYNKVLLPAGNGLITVFNLVYNGIVGVMNGIAIAVNFLLGWMGVHMNTYEYRPLNAGHMAEIDYGTLVEQGGGANGASYAGGGAGSSTSVQSVNITVHQHFEGNVIGDGGLEQVGQFMVRAIQAYAGMGGNVQVIIGGTA